MFNIKNEKLYTYIKENLESKNNKKYLKKHSTKIWVTLIMFLALLASIHGYNSRIYVAINAKNYSESKVVKEKTDKTIIPVIDKEGNRSYVFNDDKGDFKIQGKKNISYDTLVINKLKQADLTYSKNGNDYIISFKQGKITIVNYYTNNKIESIYCKDSIRKHQSDVQMKLYKYLSDKSHNEYLLRNAVKLNSGKTDNTCVFFVSEALRKQNQNIKDSVCYTGKYKENIAHSNSLIYGLLNNGWKIEYDVNKLMPGDICFSIDVKGKDGGFPTHTYTFMGWEKPDSTADAYIVDNQASQYKGEFYHIRNITASEPRDKFHFFMYKPVE